MGSEDNALSSSGAGTLSEERCEAEYVGTPQLGYLATESH